MEKINISRENYLAVAGAGFKDAHDIVTNDRPFEAVGVERVIGIELYSAAGTFTVLKEDGEDVGSHRLDPGDAGYPLGAVITGSFTHITPAVGTVVAIFKARSI